jgi:1-acyl-sn-glycerol-3-phosphate acyltransferase
MAHPHAEFPFPRRRLIRSVLQRLSHVAFAVMTDMRVVGEENIPKSGPLLAVANHFSFIDPVVMVHLLPWPVEFVGGFQMPHAPTAAKIVPKLWGFYPVFRGTGSRDALRAAEAVMAQKGALAIFPEGGAWATVLRPARPGTAYLATRTGAPILPMGFDGLPNVFPRLRRGRHARVTIRIGKPFGPLQATGQGPERRRQLDELGHEIMRRIAELLPPEQRGHYSDDPAIRAAAKGTEIFPWGENPEG